MEATGEAAGLKDLEGLEDLEGMEDLEGLEAMETEILFKLKCIFFFSFFPPAVRYGIYYLLEWQFV